MCIRRLIYEFRAQFILLPHTILALTFASDFVSSGLDMVQLYRVTTGWLVLMACYVNNNKYIIPDNSRKIRRYTFECHTTNFFCEISKVIEQKLFVTEKVP